ncbi:hypothetical protein [Paenibacillus thiaminolyticus]|uniref:hypothetical protein n=1 Tax=Paenibacillus thiaminolyticus TaxID=49283 RepID=UPI00217615B3|nr:hypothetical protein [Paenibacillus thiaminolyticus]
MGKCLLIRPFPKKKGPPKDGKFKTHAKSLEERFEELEAAIGKLLGKMPKDLADRMPFKVAYKQTAGTNQRVPIILKNSDHPMYSTVDGGNSGSSARRAEGTPKAKYTTNNLPKDPKELINNGWKDTTPEGMAKNTSSREYIDPVTGMKVRFDPGKPGANGFEGKDHYHIHNPNSTGKNDYYLDVKGNPVAKGSKASHIIP